MHLEWCGKQLPGIFQPWTCSVNPHCVCAPTFTFSPPWGNYSPVYCFLKICITCFKSQASVVFSVSIKASLQGHAAKHEQELQLFFWKWWTELLPCHTGSEFQKIGINDVNDVSAWHNSDVYQQISRPWGHRLPQAQSSHKSSLSEPFTSSKFTILECWQTFIEMNNVSSWNQMQQDSQNGESTLQLGRIADKWFPRELKMKYRISQCKTNTQTKTNTALSH